MWCVGALAPWLAQGAGQLRRQGGSTCHPPRPVIAAPAVVLTRPPVPTPTPETTALAARGSPLLPLSPPSPPLPLPPWSLLPVFFLCRRHLPCQPPPARLLPLSPSPACCRHCRRPAAPALGPPAVPPVGPWMAAPPSVRTATCGSILRFYLPPSPHPVLHSRLSVALGACTASPGRGTCVGGRRGGGNQQEKMRVQKVSLESEVKRRRRQRENRQRTAAAKGGGVKGRRGGGGRSAAAAGRGTTTRAPPTRRGGAGRSAAAGRGTTTRAPRTRRAACSAAAAAWGRRHEPRELAAEVRRLFCCCWEGDDDAAPGGRFCMAKYAAISPVCAGTAKSDALPARPPVSAMPTPAHTAQCGCSRRLAAIVLPRHSSGGQRPKG